MSRYPRAPRAWMSLAIGAAATLVCAALMAAAGVAALEARRAGGQAATPQGVQGFERAAARAIAHGRRGEAEALARARGPADQAAAAVLALLAADKGQFTEALAFVQPAAAVNPTGDAALALGRILDELGRRADARRVLAPVAASGSRARTAADLARAARAARALGQPRSASALYADAAAAAADDPAIHTAWGELFLERFNPAEAVQSFREALKLDVEWAPAHLGLARALAEEDPPAAVDSARRALEIDGALVGAHLFLAEAALDQDRPVDAREAIRRALDVNPRSPAAHALAGAIAYVEGRTADFEAALAAIFAVNPTFGEAYRIAAAQAASNYLYEDAVALARKGVALDPENVRLRADLGLHLLRTGDEREARRTLEAAFDADPYDLRTFNLLQMLDTLDKFVTVKVGSAEVRLDPVDAPVLRHYVGPLVEQAMAAFGARYQFQPKGPVLVEIFPKHDDFAVRTLGLPGLLGALGASFGRVVTIDSPRARPPGDFNWQATLWHELAHVYTLQLSRYRVPRWLTEGISVFEEGRLRPEWARDSELSFARAYADGKILKLADLNAGFTRPDTISLAYFEASLVVGLIADRHGDEGLRALLRGYADGLDTDAAFRKATGGTLANLQATLDARLQERYMALGQALQVPKGTELVAPTSATEMQALAAKYRTSYAVQMAAGRELAAANADEAAVAAFERAAALVPSAVGADSPRAHLAVLAIKRGDSGRALRELKSLVADDHLNIAAARTLVGLARKAGDQAALAMAYERIATIDPFDSTVHTALGQMAFTRGDLPVALREFGAAVAAGATDRASAHCDLGEALVAAGRLADAKREVVAALEIAPTYQRAQGLLLRIVEKDPTSIDPARSPAGSPSA